jgi:hypothetical protein
MDKGQVLKIVDRCFHLYASSYRTEAKEAASKMIEEIKQLELTAVVQAKPEVCQCYDDEIGMYMKGIEYYCASCDLPIKAN